MTDSKFSEPDKIDLDDISNNRKRIVINEINPKIFMLKTIDAIKKKYNRKPEQIVHSTTEDGVPIYALVINNKLVSDYGFIHRPFHKELPNFEVCKLS